MPVSADVFGFVSMLVEAGPIGIAAVALAEKFFPVMPSYVVFVLLGMTAASGQSDLAVAVAATVTGSTIGAFGWYCLGLALGPRRAEALIERFGRFVFLKPALYHRMTGAYRSHHFWVTVVGQTIPAVRVYLSIPAGVLHVVPGQFARFARRRRGRRRFYHRGSFLRALVQHPRTHAAETRDQQECAENQRVKSTGHSNDPILSLQMSVRRGE